MGRAVGFGSRKESRPNGFLFPSGDYQGIDIQGGRAIMALDEGDNYAGGSQNPGRIIYRSIAI